MATYRGFRNLPRAPLCEVPRPNSTSWRPPTRADFGSRRDDGIQRIRSSQSTSISWKSEIPAADRPSRTKASRIWPSNSTARSRPPMVPNLRHPRQSRGALPNFRQCPTRPPLPLGTERRRSRNGAPRQARDARLLPLGDRGLARTGGASRVASRMSAMQPFDPRLQAPGFASWRLSSPQIDLIASSTISSSAAREAPARALTDSV